MALTLSGTNGVVGDGFSITPGGAVAGIVTVGAAVTISESGIEASGIGITCASINDGQISGRRNIVINGAMIVKQRADLTMTSTSTYSLDRWRAAVGSSFNWSSATVTQSTTSPDGFGKSLKVDIASTNTPTGSQNALIQTKIEGQDLQQLAYGTSSAKQCTLSFYVRSNKTGTYCVQVANTANTKYVLFEYTINSADTWERKSVTFAGNTANTINNDNALGFDINFHLATGSDDHVSATSTWTTYPSGSFLATSNQVNLFDNASNEWYLTGCQLEVGSQATTFEHRSFGEELSLCQRYLCRLQPGASYVNYGVGGIYSSTQAVVQVNYPVSLRAAPTFSYNGALNTFYDIVGGFSSFSAMTKTQDMGSSATGYQFANIQIVGSGTAGNTMMLATLNNTNTYMDFDSEL